MGGIGGQLAAPAVAAGDRQAAAQALAALAKAPEAVNSDPYGQGWMVVIHLTQPEEISGLMDAGAYRGSFGTT